MTQSEQSHSGSLHIQGAVAQPVAFDAISIAKLSADSYVPDVSVVMATMRGEGIRVKVLLEMAGLQDDADHVTFHSLDGGYAASLTLDQACNYGILVYRVDGAPLPVERGGPYRLITPGLGDLCANVKNVGRIDITQGQGTDTRPAIRNC